MDISSSLSSSLSHDLLKAKLLIKAGRYHDAIQILSSHDNHVTKADQSESRLVLGAAYLYAGDISDVVRVLENEEDEDGVGERRGTIPQMFEEAVWYMRGVAKLQLGHMKEGLCDINRSLVINPLSYKVHCM